METTKLTETKKYYYVREKGIEIERWNKSKVKHMMVLGFRIAWLKHFNLTVDIAYNSQVWWTVYNTK